MPSYKPPPYFFFNIKDISLHPLYSGWMSLPSPSCGQRELSEKFKNENMCLWFICATVYMTTCQLLKGHRHDWGQCLFTKIIWHGILMEFLQKSHPKMYKPFWKGLSNKQSWKTHIKVFICKHWHEPFMFINIELFRVIYLFPMQIYGKRKITLIFFNYNLAFFCLFSLFSNAASSSIPCTMSLKIVVLFKDVFILPMYKIWGRKKL